MSATSKMRQTDSYPLDALTLDDELQPRAEFDRDLLSSFGEAMSVGDELPPVVAFDDGTSLLLADGYHRWHAHKALDLATIRCIVVDGSRDDALRYALSANARHGKRPTAGDMQRAYRIAVGHGFIEPTDVSGVTSLLHCTDRWARSLTQEAREKADAARDAEIIRLKGEGKTHRQVADAVHVSAQTVTDVQKRKASEIGQQPNQLALHPSSLPSPAPDPEKSARLDATREALSDRGQAWHGVLQTLRQINELPGPAALFLERFEGFDHAITPELEKAHAWINEFHRMFTNVR